MSNPLQRVRIGLLLLTVVFVGAVVSYRLVAETSLLVLGALSDITRFRNAFGL